MTKTFDERNAEKSRAVCEAMAEAADRGRRTLTEKEQRILDMWPKYEDGEYVWFDDELEGRVFCIELYASALNIFSKKDHMHLGIGERVERTAPSDSWERLEEDAGEDPFRYCKTVGKRLDTFENAEVFKSADIVRRAKALAGIEVD